MKHIMIDIETLGTDAHLYPVILSIAAVEFDTKGNTGSTFYRKIDVTDSKLLGFTTSTKTVEWWGKQRPEVFEEAIKHGEKIESVLRDFTAFLDNADKDKFVWGNSTRFDLGILHAAFSKLGQKLPWNHYNELDVRTIVFLKPKHKIHMKFEGRKHNPVDDCKHQIKYVTKILKRTFTF